MKKKLASILIAGMMVFSLTINAFAEETSGDAQDSSQTESMAMDNSSSQPTGDIGEAVDQQPGGTNELGDTREPGDVTNPGDTQEQPGETTEPEIPEQPEKPTDPGQTDPSAGGTEPPPAEEPVVELPVVNPPVIAPPVVPPVIQPVDVPVKADAPSPFRFKGSGEIKRTLTTTTPTQIKLLNVSGIPGSINMTAFLGGEKVAEVNAGKVVLSKEFTVSGSQQIEFVVAGFGDMSRANLNFTVIN